MAQAETRSEKWRLLLLPRRVWLRLYGASLLAHIALVLLVLFLLFGGRLGQGGDAEHTLILSMEAAPQLATPAPLEEAAQAELDAELDMSSLLDMPPDMGFDNLMLDAATQAAIAPAMPPPAPSAMQRRLSGGGLIEGVPQSFADYIRHLRARGIDVVFLLDATGSMVWVHRLVRERIEALAEFVRRLVPLTRFGIIAYRDHGDPDFLLKISQPSFDIARAHEFMASLEALGGGDIPEAVTAALRASQNEIGWRAGAQRIIILVGDAPPHPEKFTEALDLAARMKAQGARLSLVDSRVVANRALLNRRAVAGDLARRGALSAFRRLAQAAGGDAVTLSAQRQLMRSLALLIFDKKFHAELAPLVANLGE